ncbi:MAG: hypothetical protein Ct9H300mP8_04750 [Gammaproteobacteria bacterium]|nr:MAG: hypothetical protein Ct9H300mP8_04750 [Gammaproteobacteria bacterium]
MRQGGSTLTQQLVKSYFLDNRRTFTRKFRELVMAIILERHFEKDELLNAYINEIFLGQRGGEPFRIWPWKPVLFPSTPGGTQRRRNRTVSRHRSGTHLLQPLPLSWTRKGSSRSSI